MKRRLLLQAAAGAAACLAVSPGARAQAPTRVLIVATSHADAAGGRQTGVWLPEVTEPYWIFRDAGHAVDFGTVKGEAPPIDPRSGSERALAERLRHDDAALKAFHEAVCIDCVDGRRYAAIFLAGGRGALWDFPASDSLRAMLEGAARDRKPIGAVSHGPSGLLGVRVAGRPLAAGRTLTCFTDEDEQRAHWAALVPFSLEQRLRAEGALLPPGRPGQQHVVRDGTLVTGQNPGVGGRVARQLLDLLRTR
jgi:putative intracellular protease/amidase